MIQKCLSLNLSGFNWIPFVLKKRRCSRNKEYRRVYWLDLLYIKADRGDTWRQSVQLFVARFKPPARDPLFITRLSEMLSNTHCFLYSTYREHFDAAFSAFVLSTRTFELNSGATRMTRINFCHIFRYCSSAVPPQNSWLGLRLSGSLSSERSLVLKMINKVGSFTLFFIVSPER